MKLVTASPSGCDQVKETEVAPGVLEIMVGAEGTAAEWNQYKIGFWFVCCFNHASNLLIYEQVRF